MAMCLCHSKDMNVWLHATWCPAMNELYHKKE